MPSREGNSLRASPVVADPGAKECGKGGIESLVRLSMYVIESAWEASEIDLPDLQDYACKLGILVSAEYDPDKHGEHDFAEPGDEWFVYAPWFLELKRALSNCPAPAGQGLPASAASHPSLASVASVMLGALERVKALTDDGGRIAKYTYDLVSNAISLARSSGISPEKEGE